MPEPTLTVTVVGAPRGAPFRVAVTVISVASALSANTSGATLRVTVSEAVSSSFTVTATVPAVSEP